MDGLAIYSAVGDVVLEDGRDVTLDADVSTNATFGGRGPELADPPWENNPT